jgi:hypothetical protein
VRAIFLFLVSTVGLFGQSTKVTLQATNIPGVNSSWPGEGGGCTGTVDNRSAVSRRNWYHSAIVTSASGTWSVTLQYSNVSCTGPFTSYGGSGSITQVSSPQVAFALDNANTPVSFVHIVITGNAVVSYVGQNQLPLSTTSGSAVFPCTVSQGCVGLTTWTSNGIPYGQGSSNPVFVGPGSQYQVYQAGAAGVPAIGAVHLDQSPAITGILPAANGGTTLSSLPLTVAIGGTGVTSAQGNGSKFQLSSGTTTNNDCVKFDANGNTVDSGSGCNTFSLPSGTQNQYLRIQPNTGNNTTTQFSSLPVVSSADFVFPTQSPSSPTSLSAGINSVTMVPVPNGMNFNDIAHYVYVAGTGTPEDCLITGGSGTSGQASGVIQITCAGSHSAGYTVQSSAIGIPEVIASVCASGGGRVMIPAGLFTVNGGWTVPSGCDLSLRGQGVGATYLQMASGVVGSPGTTGNWFTWATGSGLTGSSVDIGDMSIGDLTSTNHSAGSVILLQNRIDGLVSNIRIQYGFDDITCNNCAANVSFYNDHLFAAHYGLSFVGSQAQANVSDSTVSGGTAALSVNNSQTVGLYLSNTLFDNTATGGTTSSSAIRFTEVGTNAINEVVISGCDLESIGDGLEYNGTGASYLNNSVNISGSRINAGTYTVFGTGKVNGLHIVGNYLASSGSVASGAIIVCSDCQNLSVTSNRFYGQGTTIYFVQAGGTTSKNWKIDGNVLETNNTATYTFAIALANGMDKVIIDNNDFSGISAHTNLVTGLTNSRISDNNGLQAFAVLPACVAGLEGSNAGVTDSNTTTWGATVANGGANHILTRCNGTNWTVVAK